MTIYDRVLALIKEQNLTVKQVERECDLANATIRRWATQTPNVESVRRVAHRLSVTLDYLVEGGSSNTTPGACPGSGSCVGLAVSGVLVGGSIRFERWCRIV